MRSTLLLAVLLVGCDQPKRPVIADALEGVKLKMGSAVPAFQPAVWLKGEPVKLESGRVYVIEFWATWNEASVADLVVLNDVARQFAADPVTFIAHTTADPYGNTRDAVATHIREHAAASAVRFAFDDDVTICRAWIEGAGQTTIPMCAVVDKVGKLAFLGVANDLPAVLPKVIAGTWRGQADVDDILAANKELMAILQLVEDGGVAERDKLAANATETARTAAFDHGCCEAAKSLAARLEQFQRDHPWNVAQPDVKARLMGFYVRARDFDRARQYAESTLDWAIETQNAAMLDEMRLTWLMRRYNPDRKHIDLAVRAAEAMIRIVGDTDSAHLLRLAEAYKAAGDEKRFAESVARARALEQGNAARLLKIDEVVKGFQ